VRHPNPNPNPSLTLTQVCMHQGSLQLLEGLCATIPSSLSPALPCSPSPSPSPAPAPSLTRSPAPALSARARGARCAMCLCRPPTEAALEATLPQAGPLALDLIRRMLVFNADKRIDAASALKVTAHHTARARVRHGRACSVATRADAAWRAARGVACGARRVVLACTCCARGRRPTSHRISRRPCALACVAAVGCISMTTCSSTATSSQRAQPSRRCSPNGSQSPAWRRCQWSSCKTSSFRRCEPEPEPAPARSHPAPRTPAPHPAPPHPRTPHARSPYLGRARRSVAQAALPPRGGQPQLGRGEHRRGLVTRHRPAASDATPRRGRALRAHGQLQHGRMAISQ
jgi:hypothetical protein